MRSTAQNSHTHASNGSFIVASPRLFEIEKIAVVSRLKPGLVALSFWVAPSLLTCSRLPSWPLRAPAISFVYITIKSTPWQPALDNKFISAPRPHPDFPSLIVNFHISSFPPLVLTLLSPAPITNFVISPGTQAGAALFSASAFAHHKTSSFGDRASMLASRTPSTLTFTRSCAHTHAALPSRSRSQLKPCAIHPSSSADHRGINDHQVAAPYKGGSVTVLCCPAPHSVLARCAAPWSFVDCLCC